jgi:hypothetical protein
MNPFIFRYFNLKWNDLNHPKLDVSIAPLAVREFVAILKFHSNDAKYQPHFRDSLLKQIGVDPKSFHVKQCSDLTTTFARDKCRQRPTNEDLESTPHRGRIPLDRHQEHSKLKASNSTVVRTWTMVLRPSGS